MSDFFNKDEDYKVPSTSNFMKFEDGDNRFRILGSFAEGTAIRGTVYWKTVGNERKPVRLKPGVVVPSDELELNKFGERERPKHFWALPIYNFNDKQVQILEITQKTILDFIMKQAENPKWGDPREYDFVVSRVEDKGKTTYTVANDPKEKLDAGIMQAYKDMHINIQALYEGGDPFSSKGKEEEDLVESAAKEL